MKNNLLTIIKKEFARFFGDKRMVLSVLLPGIMVYVVYSFMGDAFMNNFQTEDDYRCQIAVSHMPDSIQQLFDSADLAVDFIAVDADVADPSSSTWELFSSQVTDQTLDLLVIFPEDFDQLVLAYDPTTATAPAPNVSIYYNTTSTESETAYNLMTGVLDSFEAMLANKFDINNTENDYDLATEEDTTAMIFSMMLPMLMMTFLFSSCVAVAPESIAGEKERGTIATLLVTPMKRSSLALGKIISLSGIALLGGVSSFIGTMLSLPKLMGGAMNGMNASVYSVQDYALLLLVILSTVLVIVSAIAVISAFAKTVKEASSMASPLMIVAMLIGVSGMFGGGVATDLPLYMIPLYNSVQCMSGIFSFSYEIPQIIITMVSNLVVSGLLVFVLTKMFNSEKIMY